MRTVHFPLLCCAFVSTSCWADTAVYTSLVALEQAAPALKAHNLSTGTFGLPHWVQGDAIDGDLSFDTCIKPGPSCFLYGSTVLLGSSGIHYSAIGSLATEIVGKAHTGSVTALSTVGVQLTGGYDGAYLAISDPQRDFYYEVDFTESGFLGIDFQYGGGFTQFSVGKRFYSDGYARSFDISSIYTVSAVPEPSSGALTLVGMGMYLAFIARRRKER